MSSAPRYAYNALAQLSTPTRIKEPRFPKEAPQKKVANRRYTTMKDKMILQAVERCGRKWRSIAQFS